MRKTWRVKAADPALQERLSSELGISKITAQLLANRGIAHARDAQQFLSASLSFCHDPLLLKGMKKAVERIRHAIAAGEKILVYGDYDVDGITAVATLFLALKRLGASVEYYIPNRLEEGYGLNTAAIKKAHRDGVGLIVTVDCGTSSFKEVDYARGLGIDIIITDHHEIMERRVPEAMAVINPLQEDCPYPFKHLAGVGLAYKLVKALFEETPFFAEDYLDLVSLGTVADVTPLIGENRTLTKYGLEEINKKSRVGLKALIDVSRLDGKDISSGHIGYILGPRINAMGRIGSPQKSVELLLTEDGETAAILAKTLDTENRNRQKIEAAILEEALAKVEREVNFKDTRVIVLASEGWHPGVIGIVASRIVERYCRPAILISLGQTLGKGSGRSVETFHLFEYLLKCRDLLVGFGGHESACGLTIEKENVEAFRAEINKEAAKMPATAVFSQKLDIDMEVALNMLSEEAIHEIEKLEPFGEANQRPVLSSRNLVVKDRPRMIGKAGFKILVTDRIVTCEAVSFGRRELAMPKTGAGVDLAYTPSMNEWQGVRSVQLELKDIQ